MVQCSLDFTKINSISTAPSVELQSIQKLHKLIGPIRDRCVLGPMVRALITGCSGEMWLLSTQCSKCPDAIKYNIVLLCLIVEIVRENLFSES